LLFDLAVCDNSGRLTDEVFDRCDNANDPTVPMIGFIPFCSLNQPADSAGTLVFALELRIIDDVGINKNCRLCIGAVQSLSLI
jgi:hypothetical protein